MKVNFIFVAILIFGIVSLYSNQGREEFLGAILSLLIIATGMILIIAKWIYTLIKKRRNNLK